MVIAFHTVLADYRGEPIQQRNPDHTTTPLTLGDVSCLAINGNGERDTVAIQETMRRWRLMKQIAAAERDQQPVPLPVEDIAFIQQRINAHGFSTAVCGAAFELLEGAPAP